MKIVRADCPEPNYAEIVSEAIEIWKTELFNRTYHQTGILTSQHFLTVGWKLLKDGKDTLYARTVDTLRKNALADGIVEVISGKKVTHAWEMVDGPTEGSVGYFNPASVHLPFFSFPQSRDGRTRHKQLVVSQKLGASFYTGPAGQVTSILYDSTGTKITTSSGATFQADKVVLCTGAWINAFFDTEGQLIPKGHCLVHIQVTPAEQARYANMPVFDDTKWNIYYFSPSEEDA